MLKKLNVLLMVCFLIPVIGCAYITETVKVLWGSSTRALEGVRVDAISKTYKCSLDGCFDAVLSLRRVKGDLKKTDDPSDPDGQLVDGPVAPPANEGQFDVFINNRKKRHIVVIGIAGNINTTEVGLFFSQPSLTTVKIEVASLSGSAKRKVARIVFDDLDNRFSEAP